jgi:PAS domain S-box-containing protein
MFGLKDLESVVGRSAFDFVHRSFHESVKERIVTIQNEGGTAALVEELFLRSDGTPFWAESTACAVTIGEERSILLVLRDVTSRKELEDKLRQTEKLEVLGTLAGGVAVDFNNALHAMLGYCAVALSQPETHSNPVFRTSLKGIEESGNRASDLVGQILKFARVTDSERERVNIQPIVLDAVEFLRKSLPSSIEVQSKMERDALYVNAGPTQIYQLMLNICTNSSQAIGKEHGRLEIHVYERQKDTDPNDNHDKSENGGTITILIHDTGSGMDKRTRDRAFEPFFTTKAVGEGTGLGLSTVHGIVQSLGGSVRIDSELGEGTTVSISLPVSELSVEPEPPSPEPPEPEPISPSGLRVLFVDDEPKIVEMSVMALERNGMVVEGFTDPEAALDAFRSKPDAFDIVISDLTMPNVTGLELASHIGELNPRVPMLLCSGSFVNSTIDKTQRSTIRERLQKPI